MRISDIYWLSGILEGEGCFCTETGPKIRLKMTDRDIVARARDLMSKDAEIKIIHDGNPDHKIQYLVCVSGNKSIQIMFTIYLIMGVRRREKIREVINEWKLSTPRVRGSDYCRNGHPLLKYGKDYTLFMNPNGRHTKVCRICRYAYNRSYRRKVS